MGSFVTQQQIVHLALSTYLPNLENTEHTLTTVTLPVAVLATVLNAGDTEMSKVFVTVVRGFNPRRRALANKHPDRQMERQ